MARRRRASRTRIDLAAELAASWDRLWRANLETRLKGHDYGGRTYFLTATDLERDVREHLEREARERDEAAGVTEWRRFRISGLGGRPLLDHVRGWLRGRVISGELEADDRGRGHCSGMRFRPRGAPSSPAEKRVDATPTAERRRKRFVVHLYRESREIPHGDGTRELLEGRACEAKPRRRSPMYSGRRGRSTYPTKDPARVTCKKCLKLLERDFVRVACFGAAADPVVARVLERDAEGVATTAVDRLGNLYRADELGTEFLSAVPSRAKEAANG